MFINPYITPVRTCFACLLLVGASLFWQPIVSYAQTEAEALAEQPEQQAGPEQVEAEALAEEPEQQAAPEPTESELQTTEQGSTEQSESIPVDIDTPPSRFIPSEEISEDMSVAFPVDI